MSHPPTTPRVTPTTTTTVETVQRLSRDTTDSVQEVTRTERRYHYRWVRVGTKVLLSVVTKESYPTSSSRRGFSLRVETHESGPPGPKGNDTTNCVSVSRSQHQCVPAKKVKSKVVGFPDLPRVQPPLGEVPGLRCFGEGEG